MTSGTMSRFAKTNGETQKLGTLKTGLDNDTLTKDGSGVAAFFRTLKNKLRKTESMSPKTANFHATSKFADDKTYFIKATGRGTMARPLYQADRAGGSTVLECASSGDADGVKRLLNLGEDADEIDSDGNTALHCAAEAGHGEVINILVDRGADPNSKNEEGETALHKAAISGHLEAAKALLLRNVNFDAKNKTGWTALHEAACNGRREVARLLLDYNADPTIRTADGDTVLHKAARWNQLDIIKLLLTIGVDVSAQDNAGRTASERTNSPDIIELLQSHANSKPQSFRRPQSRDQSSRSGSMPQNDSSEGTSDEENYEVADDDNDTWNVEDQSEFYHTQWALFVSSKASDQKQISYSDVPWPGASTNATDILNVVLHGTTTQEERKKRLRSELLRWHPDKFQALFGSNLKPDDAEQIMSKVKEISQAINTASKQH